jgi:hypothetical protein
MILIALVMALGVVALASTARGPKVARTPPASPGPPAAGATAVTATIQANEAAPQTVRAHVGQLVELSVGAPAPDSVAIPAFDLYSAADPATPASFSLVPDHAGRFTIQLASSGQVVGVLAVAASAH